MRKGNWRGATEKLRLLLAVHHCDIQLKDDCSLVYVLTTFSSLDSPQRTPSPMVISSIIGGMKLRRRGLVYIPWCGCNIVFFLFVKKRVVQENGALSFPLQKAFQIDSSFSFGNTRDNPSQWQQSYAHTLSAKRILKRTTIQQPQRGINEK